MPRRPVIKAAVALAAIAVGIYCARNQTLTPSLPALPSFPFFPSFPSPPSPPPLPHLRLQPHSPTFTNSSLDDPGPTTQLEYQPLQLPSASSALSSSPGGLTRTGDIRHHLRGQPSGGLPSPTEGTSFLQAPQLANPHHIPLLSPRTGDGGGYLRRKLRGEFHEAGWVVVVAFLMLVYIGVSPSLAALWEAGYFHASASYYRDVVVLSICHYFNTVRAFLISKISRTQSTEMLAGVVRSEARLASRTDTALDREPPPPGPPDDDSTSAWREQAVLNAIFL